MRSAPIIIPAATLRRTDGSLDLDGTARYAQRFASTWAPRAIIAGPMGRGSECTPDERSALLDRWCEHAATERLVLACWEREDLDRAEQCAVQPLVMLRAYSRDQLIDQINAAPPGAWLYANPRFSPISIFPERLPSTVAGVKMSKTSSAEIRRMRQTHPGITIVHGSSRDIRSSLEAGADWVTAAPLATLPDPFPTPDLAELQGWIDRVQQQLDEQADHGERVALVARMAAGSV